MLHEVRFIPHQRFPQKVSLPEGSRVFGLSDAKHLVFILVDCHVLPEDFPRFPLVGRYFYSRYEEAPLSEGDIFVGQTTYRPFPSRTTVIPVYVFETGAENAWREVPNPPRREKSRKVFGK